MLWEQGSSHAWSLVVAPNIRREEPVNIRSRSVVAVSRASPKTC